MVNHRLLEGLNEKQQYAVTTLEGPVLIVAGPGSGKTKALTHRVAYLIEQGVSPQCILAVTFTNKAAEEMRVRVRTLLEPKNGTPLLQLPHISTFHSFAATVLRRNANLLGYPPYFTIYDEDDSLKLIRNILQGLRLDPKRFPPRKISSLISSLKNQLIDKGTYLARAESTYEKHAAEAYRLYEAGLEKNRAFDFDDLIMKTVALFEKHPEVRDSYENRFRYVLVDEYQDTNYAQYHLTRLLAGTNRNVFVIGDIDQSIYRWRHADWRNLLEFQKDFPETKVIFLEQNYRSTRHILDAANAVIAHNRLRHQKTLWTQNETGERLILAVARNEEEEARFVVEETVQLKEKRGLASWRDVAILYRMNAQSRVLEEKLFEHKIPYHIVGTVRFWERREIKDILAWIRILVNRDDELSHKRISGFRSKFLRPHSRKGLGVRETKAVVLGRLTGDFEKKSGSHTLSQLLVYIIRETGYEEYLRDGTEEGETRWENIGELLTAAKRYDKADSREAMVSFLEDVALSSETDEIKTKGNAVNLMTIHAAKGLEFPIVFIVGCEEGIFPHARSLLHEEELEEERRLCYVAITRAKKRVYLTLTEMRNKFGSLEVNPPSRFLRELPQHSIEYRESRENASLVPTIEI